MNVVENLFINDRGGNFSKFINRGNHRGASHRGTWTGYTKQNNHLLQRAFLIFEGGTLPTSF